MKFEYPTRWHSLVDELGLSPVVLARLEERDRELEDYLDGLSPGSALRFATKVVAAVDSLDKTKADYVCTGTGDQVTISDALVAAQAAAPGAGRVVLLEGTYNLSNTLTVPGTQGLELVGMGRGTRLRPQTNFNDGNPVVQLGHRARLANVYVQNRSGLLLTPGVYMLGGGEQLLEDCWVEPSGGRAVLLHPSSAASMVIRRNRIAGDIWCDSAPHALVVTDNILSGGMYLAGTGTTPIGIVAVRPYVARNSAAWIWLAYAQNGIVMGNQILGGATDGITVEHSKRCRVVNNFIEPDTTGATVVTNGIHVTGANSIDNLVTNNDMYLAYSGTAVLIDGGASGTVTAAGNRV